MSLPRFSTIRVTLLLLCLIGVILVSSHQRVFTRNWNQTLQVVVFPINGDGHLHTASYIASLSDKDFAAIEIWGKREAKRYNLDLSVPFKITLGEAIDKQPPDFPTNANAMDVLFWGLRFRYWAWRETPDSGSLTRVRLFVVYHEGEENKPLAHSLGMQKGLLGLVHAFAQDKQTAQNNIVIAHELLHTVGAIDKYESWGSPMFPVGYANPHRSPLYPQRSAEIMAGRIPVTAGRSYMAESLRSVMINEYTAREINWLH